jgi:two-component system, chemotaxis family, protein-glutamate methylesterase/glutaminase
MIKVLITDDSAFMRKAISMMIEKDPEIKVVGVARNGEEALEKIKALQPDVLTLDVEMPGMNGLEVLKKVMSEDPLPVLMISSLTKEGAEITFKALELGAMDFITKNLSYVSMDITKLEKDIIEKIKAISKRRYFLRKNFAFKSSFISKNKNIEDKKFTTSKETRNLPFKNKYRIIAVGSSTGGPGALQEVISKLPKNLPCPIVIAQHMPPGFTRTFSERLNSISEVRVKEAENDEYLEDGTVYIAPGNTNMSLIRKGAKVYLFINPDTTGSTYVPSVNVLIGSVAEVYRSMAIGVILTGMGNDGLEGIKKLKSNYGYVIAQDEATCVIYGMPKAIIDNSLADCICPINEVTGKIVSIV